jgi:hypothetical protein
MAMVYTLVASAKEWLTEHYGQNGGDEQPEETEAKEEEVFPNHFDLLFYESAATGFRYSSWGVLTWLLFQKCNQACSFS